MTKAVIFDMFETLITHYKSPLYFGAQMSADAGIPEDKFRELWRPTEHDRTIGKMTLEEAVEGILRANQCYSDELLKELVKVCCFRILMSPFFLMNRAFKSLILRFFIDV